MTSQPAPKKASNASRWRAAKRRKNTDGSMSLVEHLRELRRRVIISLLAFIGGTILGFIWYQTTLPGIPALGFRSIPSLGDILREPYCALPPASRADFSFDGECRLLATGPFEMFMLRLKVGALAGSVISSPVWLYQIWAFITPGLHKNERKWTFSFVTIAVILFLIGAALAYTVVHFGLAFLLTIGDQVQTTALTGHAYFGFLLALLVIFGVSFEVPLIIAMLNIVGIIEYENIKEKRRMIIVVLFIFAAFMTPGGDPFSMTVLACALTALVEIAMQFCRLNDKRRKRQRPDWLDLDDDQASTLGPDEVAAASAPIPRPEPINPSAAPVMPTRPIPTAPPSPSPAPRNQPVNPQTPPAPGAFGGPQGPDFSDVL
ncbi:sec-independent protein translocase protein TatC [Corynebacterium spheniscorum]|uniref:Sec-independent protein translocase protein TatC n=2 Tax=Corynebacterium spheniscorum TaxID=185761 RepID=A0A1I2STW5_9CORY|nr:sec-independent protein translocase protein TatC [Corynebacterium spheniscorum]